MYGLIGKIRAVAGRRAELVAILIGNGSMPGCVNYIVAEDAKDSDVIWVTEIWDSRDAHRASLQLPEVQAAIAKGRPLIAAFEQQVETVPLGGIGLDGIR